MATNERQGATECSQCAEMRAKLEKVRKALQEILDEAIGDLDRDIIITAAQGALSEAEL